MPETDVLNPQTGWVAEVDDSMNPNYGWERERPSTLVVKRAAGGPPYSRGLQAGAHRFNFTWVSRSLACVQRLKRYYEQYEEGFFTIIDHDGGGRHYVGRFVTDVKHTQAGNNRYNATATFEEVPGVPMLQYPNDWVKDAVLLKVNNDFGDQKVATEGVWAKTVRAFGVTLDTSAATAWAQYEYRGYGFRLHMLKGPAQGQADVYLDGVKVATVDCNSAAALSEQIVLTQTTVSLDIHRVKVVALSGNVGWYALEVMR